jgi:hypothetical protein
MGEAPRKVPFALDFLPLQGEAETRIHPFFDHLREGRLTTTRCTACGEVLWQPRVVCPHCNAEAMEWVDLPTEGRLYAFSAVVLGAPKGMEADVPFSVGIVELPGTDVKVLARIDAPYEELAIGQSVRLKVQKLEDGRVWFRFAPPTP